ncbi:telomerase RNA component interacting RNase [Nilaparvata lugens]|uniref:telomerase RNA component interacting RNase n=1 Tax=Nilaparvata lugens TaxID=108931 RepID=UPI000B97ED4C|nr:telomerase RNA component interacting RNase isoform X1 [Nilaparvata lugens]XP_039301411.1 telomerase RNA component interacting RNase [Nilaparvata lugens]
MYPSSGSGSGGKSTQNAFRNDGSFLEMFKRMQEATATASTSSESAASAKPSVSDVATEDSKSVESEGKKAAKPPMVGKRRGGRVLPTGQVKKVKQDKPELGEDKPKDAWSQYLAEVKKYRETTCEEEGKTRPLVK